MNIIDILMCPECKNSLSEGFLCKGCHSQYHFTKGIYDIVSQNLSGELLRYQQEVSDFLNKRRKTEKPKSNSEECNQAWQQLYQKRRDFINPLLSTLSGTVCDLATGGGTHLNRLLKVKSNDFNIVCIDVKMYPGLIPSNPRVYQVAGDARYMPIKDNSFDYITSLSVFDNVSESDKVVKEMYRTLKPHGKIIIDGDYINKNDSKSYELAKSMKLEKGMVEEYLIRELENAGFKNIVSTIIAEIRKERQEGLLPPVVGDMMYSYVLQAEKS